MMKASDTDEDEIKYGLYQDEQKSLLKHADTRQLHHAKQQQKNETENMVENFNKKIEELKVSGKKSCANCSKEKRVEDMNDLKRGQHISVNGYIKAYIKPIDKQVALYRHHAIIKEVTNQSRYSATVVCIHFSKDKQSGRITVLEETITYSLQKDDLSVTEYQRQLYTPDVIVQRAESILRDSKDAKLFQRYCILMKNCEHFATWCVVGKEESLQARNFLSDAVSAVTNLFSEGSKIARLILKIIYNYTDDMTTVINAANTVPLAVLGGFSVAYLIYCIIRTVYLIKQYRTNKEICWSCLKGNLLDIWLQCGALGVTSAVMFVITHFALPLIAPGIGISIAVVLGLLSTALTLAVPKIRRALQSPFQCDTNDITTLSELKPGDAISLTYYGLKHLILVSEVKFETDPKKGTLRGIHYSLPRLFSRMVIAEEDFQVDLTKSKVTVLQLDGLNTFSAELALDRARKRVGEKKWCVFSNTSDHSIFWAMIKTEQSSTVMEWTTNEEIGNSCASSSTVMEWTTNEEIGNSCASILSSFCIGKAEVHLIDEISLGDVVGYRFDKGIIVKLENLKEGRLFNIEMVVHKGIFKPYGRRVSHRIDLDKDNLVVHKYNPSHCVSRDVLIKKALDMIDKPSKYWTQSGFIKYILKHPSS